MASLNKVFLIGNLTRDPELRYIPSGAAVASFGMAINMPYTTPTGERKEETCFVRVVVWGKQAENVTQYLSKGRLVFVEGRLIYRSWESEGKTRSILEVRADRIQFLGPLAKGAKPETGTEQAPSVAEEGSEAPPAGEGEETPF